MRERFHISFVVSILIFFFVLIAGAFVYHNIERWSAVDSAYFVAVTVTTVGYGDVHPVTDVGKIFTIFYSFFGVVFAFYYVSLISRFVLKKHLKKHIEGKSLKKKKSRKRR